MRINLYTGTAFFALLIFSCTAINKLLTFTITDQYSFTIDSRIPVGIPLDITTQDISSSSSTEFKNNNTNSNLVKDVRLSELKLTITDPSSQTFSFLKSIHIYISTDGTDEVELAYLDAINSTSTSISLNTSSNKLDKYIKASTYKLRIEAVTKEALTNNTSINAEMKFKVTANPF